MRHRIKTMTVLGKNLEPVEIPRFETNEDMGRFNCAGDYVFRSRKVIKDENERGQ